MSHPRLSNWQNLAGTDARVDEIMSAAVSMIRYPKKGTLSQESWDKVPFFGGNTAESFPS